MTSAFDSERLHPRPLPTRRWRTILAGGVLAGVGFVAAQAGSFDFLQLDLVPFAKSADHEKPKVAQGPTLGPGRSHSSGPASQSADGMFVSASRNATGAVDLGSDSEGAMPTGEATLDAGLFELSPVVAPMSQAASQGPLQFGGRFENLVEGSGPGSQGSAPTGSGRQRVQEGLAGCCDDPSTPPDDPRLTAPTLQDAIGGPVPETGAWAMMILGFSLSGLVLRGQRRTLA